MTKIKNAFQFRDCWTKSFRGELGKSSLIGVSPWDDLLEEVVGITEILNNETIENYLDTFNIQKLSDIDRLSLGPKILSLVEGGLSSEQISYHLSTTYGCDITVNKLETWLEEYKNSGIIAKATLSGDVFDSRNQMQALLDKVLDKLNDIETKADNAFRRNSKDEVIAQYLDMIRAIIKDANVIQQQESSKREAELFIEICLEVIREVNPQIGLEVFKRLKAKKVLLLGST